MTEKYLAFDVGLRQTGVAVSETDLASPLITLQHQTYAQLLTQIEELVKREQPQGVVLGDPGRGTMHELVGKLKKDLEELSVRTVLIDESSTTKRAQDQMLGQGLSAIKRRRREHQVVAALLLQDYLDSLVD